jgi:hypothetical protein
MASSTLGLGQIGVPAEQPRVVLATEDRRLTTALLVSFLQEHYVGVVVLEDDGECLSVGRPAEVGDGF